MAHADRFRDSTQILLPVSALEGIRDELERRFVLSIRNEGDHVRLIGSPAEIKDAGDFLAMNGIRFA